MSTYSPQNYICRAWDVVLIVPEAAIQRLPGYSFQEQGGLRKGTLGIISSLVVSKLNLKVLLTQADPNASRVGLPCHRCPAWTLASVSRKLELGDIQKFKIEKIKMENHMIKIIIKSPVPEFAHQ